MTTDINMNERMVTIADVDSGLFIELNTSHVTIFNCLTIYWKVIFVANTWWCRHSGYHFNF